MPRCGPSRERVRHAVFAGRCAAAACAGALLSGGLTPALKCSPSGWRRSAGTHTVSELEIFDTDTDTDTDAGEGAAVDPASVTGLTRPEIS